MNIRITLIQIIIPALLVLSCAESPNKPLKQAESARGPAEQFHISKDLIDREKTAEVYFRLEKSVSRIHVSVRALEKMNDFDTDPVPSKTFFIVDKAIDVTRFNPDKGTKLVYTELARNFTPSWERELEIDVVSQKDDPILTLDKDSLYRLRFTVFNKGNYTFDISIQADCRVFFTDAPPLP